MLSRQGTTLLSGAVLCLVLAVPAIALEPLDPEHLKGGPVVAVCEELRRDMVFYHGLFMQGGNARQMAVWKKKYQRLVWDYGRGNCPRLHKRMAASRKASQPVPAPASAPALASSN